MNPDSNLNETQTLMTPEAVRKTDLDIQTIRSLSELAERSGNQLIINGGYAVEAICGGNITRPHGDIDAHFILSNGKSDEIFSAVDEIISKETQTDWKLRKQKTKKGGISRRKRFVVQPKKKTGIFH